MKWMLVSLVVFFTACAGTPLTPKTAATDAVNVVEAAWMAAATACTTFGDAAVKSKCALALIPARSALLAAALDVDQGGTDYACELAQVSTALSFVTTLGVKFPSAVTDAQTLLANVPCVLPEAGTPTASKVLASSEEAATALAQPLSESLVGVRGSSVPAGAQTDGSPGPIRVLTSVASIQDGGIQ
jgi:hypothetical protein